MRIFGLAGSSDDDRVALTAGILSELTARGVKASVVRRGPQGFDVDRPGKDSDRHRAAGAAEVMVTSAKRWALIHDQRGSPAAAVTDLLAHMSPADLLIVDGFEDEPHPRLVLHRRAAGAPPSWAGDRRVVAVASDIPLDGLDVPVLDVDDVAAIADFILGHCGL